MDDPGITPGAVLIPLPQFSKEFGHHLLGAHHRQGQAPGVQVAPFGQGNDLLGPHAGLLGLGPGGFYPLPFKQRGHQISEHGQAMFRCPAQAPTSL